MTRILLCGCNGKMGRTIAACAAKRDDCKIVAGVDINTTPCDDFPVFSTPKECNVPIDVIVDFSHPSCLDGVLQYATENHIPAVIATTGLSKEQRVRIQKAAEKTPLFSSANMSLGVSLLTELVKKAAEVLGGMFDIEIIEKHHNQKVDAPSGTALMLADAVKDVLPEKFYTYGREGMCGKRNPDEIGIHAIRGGNIVGEHDVIFAGANETVTLSHQASDRSVFAEGAVLAAEYISTKKSGMYNMSDLINKR